MNINAMIAKCAACGELFSFADLVPSPVAAPVKTAVQMPKGFDIAHQFSDLVITRRWFSASYVGLLFFCIIWNGILGFMYGMFIKGSMRGEVPLAVLLFPLLHVAVGLYLIYVVLAGFLNRTEIRVNPTSITVRHFPMPWGGNKTIPSMEIDQLFCEERQVRRKRGYSTYYDVSVVRKGGNRLKLVSGLESPDHAAFIEQQIEAYMGIADRQVAGEMRPV